MGDVDAKVAGLHLYPVKGLGGSAIADAEVEWCGLAGDRRWMVVDPTGRFITQRECAAMARIRVEQVPGGLVLCRAGLCHAGPCHAGPCHAGADRFEVAVPGRGAEEIAATVWRSTVPAMLASPAAGRWLSDALGTPCRLVHLADPGARTLDPAYSRDADRVSFADGFPVLLASVASLDDVNSRLDAPVPMTRFRPNLVITGAPAWAEDHWRRIRIGEAEFRLPKACSRCIVTSIDQRTGERPVPREPLHALAAFRRTRHGVMFGQNLIPDRLGRIAPGDRVTVLEAGPSNVVATGRGLA